MKNVKPFLFGIFAFSVITAMGCICLIGGVGIYWLSLTRNAPIAYATLAEFSTPTLALLNPVTPTQTSGSIRPIQPVPPPKETSSPLPSPTEMVTETDSSDPSETLKVFENTIVPINDFIDLARRLEGKQNLPTQLDSPIKVYQVGSQENFWATNTDTNQNIQVAATLRYETDHVYFWIEDGVNYNEKYLEALVETFERQIYPTNRAFFGSEWTPGVDADPHLFILYAGGLGGPVAGYFSTVDEYLPVVREDSNAHEMFLLSSDKVDLNQEFAYGVLAHEFQHMIHWYRDRNEEVWMNEGFSDLAMLLNGYSIGGHDRSYVRDPDIQLTDWYPGNADNTPHYGASFLFMTYFLDRFGETATQALVAEPANGMVSIDAVLQSLGINDQLTAKPIQADDIFQDWVIASFLQDGAVSDGRYTYSNYPNAPSPGLTESIRSCKPEPILRDVFQYGVDYIGITCRGDHILRFEAPPQVPVLPVSPHSGKYAFYSNQGEDSDMTLTQFFDFSDHSGSLTLSYWTWYDLEKDYDYMYLTASLDGENWLILTTPSGTPEDPSGNSYGWGYNGYSGNGNEPQWIQENVDISQFAGKQVQLRFEYVTDAGVNGEGFLLDDLSIPEINYVTDFEKDDGNWQSNGFVRIQNLLPQTFRLALISKGKNSIVVEKIGIAPDNTAEIPFHISDEIREVILVVSGATRFTRQKAIYQISFQH